MDGRSTVIFTIGFTADLSWLPLPFVDEQGAPRHVDGRSAVDGVWSVGWAWMRARTSGIILDAAEDGAHVVDQVVRRARAGHATLT